MQLITSLLSLNRYYKLLIVFFKFLLSFVFLALGYLTQNDNFQPRSFIFKFYIFLTVEYYFTVYMNHVFIFYSSGDDLLGYLYFLAFGNKAAMNIDEHVSL